MATSPEQLAATDGSGSHAETDLYYDGKVSDHIHAIIEVIRAKLVITDVIVAATLALAVIVTLLQTPRYTAETSLQTNNQAAQIFGRQDDTMQDPVVQENDAEHFPQTRVDILKSRALAERIAQELRLVGSARFYDATGLRQPTADLRRAELADLTIRTIEDASDGDLPRTTRQVTVSFVSTPPELAAKIANAFVTEFVQANLQRRFDSLAYARDFISGQLAEAQARLQDLNASAQKAGLIRDRDGTVDGASRNGSLGISGTITSLLEVHPAANQAPKRRASPPKGAGAS